MRGLGRYYELRVECRGEADPQTGYFINIKQIDTAVRDHVLPALRLAVADEAVAARAPVAQLLSAALVPCSRRWVTASMRSSCGCAPP